MRAALVAAALAGAAAVLLQAGPAGAVVTPCSAYNELHSVGNGNCYECTNLYFNSAALDPSASDYIMGQSRDRSFYPMRKPVKVELKYGEGMTRCLWCPVSQTCGHPLDRHTDCHGLDGREQNGWLKHDQCVESDVERKKRAEDQEQVDNEQAKDMDEEEREKWLRDEALKASHPTEVKVLETVGLHYDDTIFDCRGQCVTSGWTGCDATLLHVRAEDSEEHRLEEASDVSPGDRDEIQHGDPIACRFNYPGDGLTPRRAVGRWSPSSKQWSLCELVPCTPLPV